MTPTRDLIPIANVTALSWRSSAPAVDRTSSTLREFFELLRANPGKFNAAAANGNADFLMSGFLKSNSLEMAKVPYRDIMQAPNDLAENRIQLLSSSLAIVTPLTQAGKIKVLAVTGRQRAPSVPDMPTVREAGYPALEMESIGGIFGRAACRSPCASRSPPTCAPRSQAIRELAARCTHRTGRRLRGPAEFAAGIKEIAGQARGHRQGARHEKDSNR